MGASPSNDIVHIPELIDNGKSAQGLAKAWKTASKALPEFPHNGCAAHLSALLQESGIDIQMTIGAGNLARLLEKRGWQRIEIHSQQDGDVGVTYDLDPDPPGPDHVYLVVERLDDDDMLIADNQRHSDEPHHRSATGKHGKTHREIVNKALPAELAVVWSRQISRTVASCTASKRSRLAAASAPSTSSIMVSVPLSSVRRRHACHRRRQIAEIGTQDGL